MMSLLFIHDNSSYSSVIVALGAGTLLWLWFSRGTLPSVVVVVRTARAHLPIAYGAWTVWRIFFANSSEESSLLELLLTALHRLKEMMATPYALSFGTPPALLADKCWILLEDFAAIVVAGALWRVLYMLFHYSLQEWQDLIINSVFDWAKENVPMVKSRVESYRIKLQHEMQVQLGKDPNRTDAHTRLPRQGISTLHLTQQLQEMAERDNGVWKTGKVSGCVYANDDPEPMRLMVAAYRSYCLSNPLHPDVWPSVTQMEAEIVAMTSHMLHGTGIGTTTSGGTESIFLSLRAHAQWYGRRRRCRGILQQYLPEVLCSATAHAGVDKACDVLRLRKVVVPHDPITFTLDANTVERYITSNTIMIYASAPSFAQGVVDPIPELSDLARRYDIGLHVDACLGGFVLPFARQLQQEQQQQLGYDDDNDKYNKEIEKFDFECEGVTAMSVDPHKFAYATKGVSVVLYRHNQLRHSQYFAYSKWTGGMYVTPTLAGSRSGGILASAWATMLSMGEEGYLTRVKSLMEASQTVADGISKIPGIRVLGQQRPTIVVAFTTTTNNDNNIYLVGDLMKKRGWHLNALQNPPALHLCLTLNTIPVVYKFIDELRESVAEAHKMVGSSSGEKDANTKGGTAGIYGMSGSMPAGPVNEILNIYTDLVYTP